jgi:hypothetical protein
MPFLLLGCGLPASPASVPFSIRLLRCRTHGCNDISLEAKLVLFFTDFLAIALACQRFLHSLLFARFQVERMALNFLDDVFSLHLALEAAQRILKGFAFLNSNFCQWKNTSKHASVSATSRISLSG